MRVEFDYWHDAHDGSAFFVEMNCLPRVGEVVDIHKDHFPSFYFTGAYARRPIEVSDGMISVMVSIVAHAIPASGRHIPQVCFDFHED